MVEDSDSDYASDHSDVKTYCRCIYTHEAMNADELHLNVGGTGKNTLREFENFKLNSGTQMRKIRVGWPILCTLILYGVANFVRFRLSEMK